MNSAFRDFFFIVKLMWGGGVRFLVVLWALPCVKVWWLWGGAGGHFFASTAFVGGMRFPSDHVRNHGGIAPGCMESLVLIFFFFTMAETVFTQPPLPGREIQQ
ncbi:hypothetical protein HOY80DRAFT_369892 [Tuber brumale]|nr:hypothetical protein HOY80DRAFT_369892 [Tuber brumale]